MTFLKPHKTWQHTAREKVLRKEFLGEREVPNLTGWRFREV